MDTYNTLDHAAFRMKMIAAHIEQGHRLEARELHKLADSLYGLIDETMDRIAVARSLHNNKTTMPSPPHKD
jgi:hypothetical protein